MTNPDPRTVAGSVSRLNEDGTTSDTDFIVDKDTGQTVAVGAEMSQDAADLIGLFAGIAAHLEDDDDK